MRLNTLSTTVYYPNRGNSGGQTNRKTNHLIHLKMNDLENELSSRTVQKGIDMSSETRIKTEIGDNVTVVGFVR